jgi:threonine/homoserine/homoserine lactone efflux protein
MRRVIPGDHLLAFSLVALALIFVPGPSVLFIISRALAQGRRAAVTTAVGNEVGELVQAAAVALGIGVVVERSVVVFTAIKLVGAAYLVILGVRAVRDRRFLVRMLDGAATPHGTARILREGFVVGISNPKTGVFFAAILPEFVDRRAGHVPVQLFLLGLVFALIALVSDSIWGLAAGTARAWFARSPRRLERVGGAGGLVMVGLGARLAFTGRKS